MDEEHVSCEGEVECQLSVIIHFCLLEAHTCRFQTPCQLEVKLHWHAGVRTSKFELHVSFLAMDLTELTEVIFLE